MKKAKQIISLLLAAQLLLLSAVSCSEKTDDNKSQDDTQDSVVNPNSTSPETETDAEAEKNDVNARVQISDELPEKTFGGKSFRVMTTNSKEYQFVSEEMTGETTSDSVYDRNLRIEDRFDCKIETVIEDYPYSAIDQYVTSGTNVAEIVDHYEYMSYQPISKGNYLDWNTIPYINQDKPWWNKESNEGSTINGKLFCIVGDLSITSMQFTYAMFFNMALMETYGYTSDQLYSIVLEGNWTLDKLREIASTVYVDNNGDGLENEGDTFGYAYWNYHGTDVWVTAMGEHLTQKEGDQLKVTLGTEKVYSALEKVVDLVYNTTGAHKFTDESFGRSEFIGGHIGIMPLMFDDCYSALRDMEDPYGVLPYPKYDEAQTNYYTNSMDQHSVFGVPKTLAAEDYEFVGIMMEVLNAESYKTVIPAFYDTALKNRYSEDAATAQMIDLIMDGRVYEFSFQFGSFLSGLPYMFRNCLYDNSTDLASTLQKNQKAINKKLKDLYKLYEN